MGQMVYRSMLEESEMGGRMRELEEELKKTSAGRQFLEDAEPCEDAVSREDVIKAIDRHTFDTDDGLCLDEDITIILEELPPVTPAQRWIPVSERLPEENGFYLATCDGEICGENEPFTGLAEYENGKWVDDEEDYQCVLAWMPLPKPYTERLD